MKGSWAQKGWKEMRWMVCWAALAACSSCAGVQSALDPAGPQSLRLDRMWWLMFWVCVAVFVVVMMVFTLAIRGARKRAQPDNEPATERKVTKIIAGALSVSAFILFGLMIADFVTGR